MSTPPVAIIGAGPLGIELAVALKRAGIPTLHFDAKQIGYTISTFPPQTRFFSSNERIAIAGVPLQTPDQMKCTREQYLAYLRCVVQQYDLNINTYEPVTGIRRTPSPDTPREAMGERLPLTPSPGTPGEGRGEGVASTKRFTLTTLRNNTQQTYTANKIILATGGTAHPRRLNVPGEDLPHVHAHWSDPHVYFNKKVLIVGGKNSAVETALRFHNAGAKVALSYRRAELPAKSIKYWLLPEINSLIKSGAINAHPSTEVTRITPTHVHLSSGVVIEADFIVPQIGYTADMSLCKLANIKLEGDRHVPIYNPQTMESNIPGIYLCGTVIGGTQDKYEVFIENGHVHVEKILAHLTGANTPIPEVTYTNPES
jgi:thioredoxin reductase (NADPH)